LAQAPGLRREGEVGVGGEGDHRDQQRRQQHEEDDEGEPDAAGDAGDAVAAGAADAGLDPERGVGGVAHAKACISRLPPTIASTAPMTTIATASSSTAEVLARA